MADKKSKHVTATPKQRLIEYITKHPEMNSSKLSPSFTRNNCRKMWLELTDILNSIPTGPAKSAEEWRKTWNDLKKNTKKKVSAMNAYRVITGGGPPLEGHLNDEEEQILTIVKPTQILGDPEVVESQVIFEWNVKNVENTTNETVTNRDTALTENNIVEDKGNILEAISPQINYDEHDYCPLQNNIDENIAEKCQKKRKYKADLTKALVTAASC